MWQSQNQSRRSGDAEEQLPGSNFNRDIKTKTIALSLYSRQKGGGC